MVVADIEDVQVVFAVFGVGLRSQVGLERLHFCSTDWTNLMAFAEERKSRSVGWVNAFAFGTFAYYQADLNCQFDMTPRSIAATVMV
jgi:hypothetical protein